MMNPETTRRGLKCRTIAALALLPLLATALPATLVATVLPATLPAQNSAWTKKTKRQPATRYGQAMAYDSLRQRVVMFGGIGNNGSTHLDETWEWNGSRWSEKNPTNKPPARFCPGAMAYDAARGVCVLFGGSTGGNGTGAIGDTWTWNGNDWTNVTPATSPSARYSQAMTYDSAAGVVVLFGGTEYLAAGSQDDTWTWNGAAWTLKTPNASPPKTSYHAMAYDSIRGRSVMFGGRDVNDVFQNATWEWDGFTWINLSPANGPTARRWHAMAYDLSCGCIVMFGGFDATSSPNADFLNDSWKWNGTSWTELTFAQNSALAPPRIYHAMAYDAARERTVLFGSWQGNGVANRETWLLDAAAAAPQPPAAPSGLVATATPNSSSRIDLVWIDNATNEDGFEIQRSSPSNNSWASITNVGPNVTAFSDTGLTASTLYYYRVRAFNTGGNSAFSPAVNAMTNSAQPGDATANQDIAISGTVSGSYVDTHTQDIGYESITEHESGGKKSDRYSYLEHKWAITAPAGNTFAFHIVAKQTASSDGDVFDFAWSSDGQNWAPMFAVSQTVDQALQYNFTGALSGTIYIRVTDRDRTKGNKSLDTIFIDHMYISGS